MDPSATRAVRPSALVHDALVTVATRFGLAILIFGTDIVLARLLGPAAKGRFALVLLYSQLTALLLGWGMDSALAVVAGRSGTDARHGIANAITWSLVVGGFGALVSAWGYGLGEPGPPNGPLVAILPNLSTSQFLYAVLAIPGELFFGIGLFALLGRRRVVAYGAIRLLRRTVLLALVVAMAAVARLSLDVALLLNLAALALTATAILLAVARADLLSVRPSLPLLAEELSFGSRSLPGAIAERLQFRADAFVVNGIVGVRATGIYSVTSGLAETLWYVPNALGLVMFSRAVDPRADAARIAVVLTRTTLAVTLVTAVPMLILGPYVVRSIYGSTFADAGVALRWILPGIVAYSIVAVLTRYVTGRSRPGTATVILLAGAVINLAANLVLIPRLGINGAALASSISYGITALLTLAVFTRISGRGWIETLVIQPEDLAALRRAVGTMAGRFGARSHEADADLGESSAAAEVVLREHEPGDEP